MHRSILWALLFSTCLLVGLGQEEEEEEDEIKQLSPQELTGYVLDHRQTAVFIYSGTCDESCAKTRRIVAEAWLHSTDFLDDLVLVQSDVSATRTGPWYADKQPLPLLLFYRDAQPIVYAGDWSVEMMSMWFSDNQESAVQELMDDTFEHDTQAATGATTGDWLVLFYSKDFSTCVKCADRLTSLHTVASRLRSRFVFGAVNIDTNPKLKERFSINSPPLLSLFRKGQVHYFEEDHKSKETVSKQLAHFITEGYSVKRTQKVTLGKPTDSSLLEDLLPYLGILAAVVVPFIIAGAVLERIARRQKIERKKARAAERASGSNSRSARQRRA